MLKNKKKHLEFLEEQEEYIKDEQLNLRKEFLHAQEEVKRIQSVPLVIGQFLDAVNQNTGIAGSTILSIMDHELLSLIRFLVLTIMQFVKKQVCMSFVNHYIVLVKDFEK